MSCRPEHTHTLKLFTINASATMLSAAATSDINLWQLKTWKTHYHNHHRHHCHLLFTALLMPLQFTSAQNKLDQIDCSSPDNTTSWSAPRGKTPSTWLKETLTEFCVCVCVCVWKMLFARLFVLVRSVMLVISNLLWFLQLSLVHFNCLKNKFTSLTLCLAVHSVSVHADVCKSVCVCARALTF